MVAKHTLTITAMVILSLSVKCCFLSANRCDTPVGLQDGTIPDANITFPERVRLGGDAAWCFTVSGGAVITLTVDLGTTRLVSGVMVQGPPASLYPITYHYAIGFWILNSTVDATGPWGICCGDNVILDEYEEAEVTQVHPLESLVLARYLRLQFRTDVLSIGNDTKCLRLEILGCPTDMEPDSGVGLTAERSGWVVMSWRPPVVQLPQVDGSLAPFTLTTTDYQVSVSRTGGGEPDMAWEANVKALRYVLPLPLWGATYSATVVCVHQGRQIGCGAASLTAVLDSCDTCIEDEVSWENVEGATQTTGYGAFLADVSLSADVLWNGTLKLTWLSAQVCDMTSESAAQPTMAAVPQPTQTTQVIQTTQSSQTKDVPQATDTTAGVLQAADTTTTTTSIPQATDTTSITSISQATDRTATTQATQTPEGANNNGSAATDVPSLTDNVSPSEAVLTPPTRQPTTLPQQTPSLVPDIPLLAPGSPSPTTDAPTLPPPTGTVVTAVTYTLNITYNNASIFFLRAPLEQASETVQQGEGSTPGEQVMRVFMTLLSFQTLYTVSVVCNFGSISLECGTRSTFTDLPLHIVRVEGQDVVHVLADGRAGWAQQEARCRRGDGNLVSLSTREEEALLMRSLTRDPSRQPNNFWLGLNLCQTYTGTRWSDGSVWRDIWRVYNPDSQLSSTTCCIKAAWTMNQYSWIGEACDALLPAVCEYRPNGLMGRVALLEQATANTTQAGVTWTYEPNFWTPTSFQISYCPFRNLENVVTDSGNASDTCLTSDLDAEAREHQQDDLEPFTEYQVTVAPSFMQLNYTSGAAITYIRTFPENPLLVRVDSAGFVNIMYALKVSEFSGEEEISVRLAITNPYAVVAQRRVPASGVRFGGIQLGVNYTVSVREVQPLRRREALTLLALVINDLQPDTGYTLVLEADLGSNVLVTSEEFTIFTTNDTTGKLVSPLLLGMSPMLQYQALQLVCNSLLVAACIITMLFFFATGMFYQDCVAQLGFESALMVAYLVLMIVYPTSAQTNSETACIGVAVALHFLFLCAFTFLMLEALTIAHLLVIYIKSPFQRSNWVMVVAGVSLPLLVVAFTAGFGSQEYPDLSVGNCWVNPNGSAMWGEVVPICLLVAATIFLLGNTFFTQQTPPELAEEDHRGRQCDSHKLRWVVLALCVELLVAWSFGVAANQSGDQGTYVFFCVMTLVLATTIVGARTSFDDTFRSKMHRLCCGTELTYKRSEILSISARSRITPTRKPEDVSRTGHQLLFNCCGYVGSLLNSATGITIRESAIEHSNLDTGIKHG
ncbi:Adhesion G protein-coupled receptor L3 [Portunus trituberculatus]|uniref:Adhesion G protein-coupled receptor L3 n=1 Tax=Portunus trituberculatus TaxID=210409 RepID=A0A5B7CMG8_PORTR|nr:Adhesion G protein-coupled receptor L3 [Portunus trituberculatus]